MEYSKPVGVEGEVILYVPDPSTGSWDLPFLSESGTDMLVFDAAAEGKPTLVEIGFLGYGPDVEIMDEGGVRANSQFDAWRYE